MDLSIETELMEESAPDDSEPSTPKSVASPAFSLIGSLTSMQHSGDEAQPEDNKNVLDNCHVQTDCGGITNVSTPFFQQSGIGREGTVLPSQQSGSGCETSQQSCGENQCSGVAEKDTNTSETAGPVTGIKIVIDDIDKNVKPRFKNFEKQTKSIHYVQIYAVRDRTDISQLSDNPPVKDPSLTVDDICKTILPSREDNDAIAEYFSILVSRALVTHMPFFSMTFDDVVQWRIPHKFTEEMSQKSEVVSTCMYTCIYRDSPLYPRQQWCCH